MERLNSNSDNSTSHSPDNRLCAADSSLRSDACKKRGSLIEPERARSAKYCSTCAPFVRNEQSKLDKRELRRNPFWRRRQRELRKERRQKHRDYMRVWRSLRREAEATARAEEQGVRLDRDR